jgi:hypothetical protein
LDELFQSITFSDTLRNCHFLLSYNAL